MTSTTMTSPPKSVAIIGAGLGGLTLALSLKKRGITARFYELRTPDYDFGGALMLSPNALRVLNSIGAYERIRTKGYNFETLTFKNDEDQKTTGEYYFGHEEMYGFKALRIYRKVLIGELRKMVAEQEIPIEYGRKFTHIVSEDDNGVRFAFEDGTEETAEMLIGADGIHSKVRRYIVGPEVVASYSGFLGVTYAFPTKNLRIPQTEEKYPLPVSIHGKLGAFIIAPQNPDGGEIFAGRQFRYPMQDRHGWDVLLKAKTELIDMHQRDSSQWSDLVQSAQEQLSGTDFNSLNIWPFHTVPKMDRWSSEKGRVIMIGDAAHAIPPTAGQGANQAFEDAHTLTYLLGHLSPTADLTTGLSVWQKYRQARVDKVLILSDQMNTLRLSEEDKKNLPKEKISSDGSSVMGGGNQLAWLYNNDVEEDMARELANW